MALKNGTHRTNDQRDKDRARVADMLVRCRPIHEIAEAIGVSRITVFSDIKAVREAWRLAYVEAVDTIAHESIQLNSTVKREALEEWIRSKEDEERRQLSKTEAAGGEKDATTRTAITKVRSLGDGKYLEIALKADENLRKLLGADSPTKFTLSVSELDKLSDDELDAIESRLSR